jgi:hypothetical protein
MISNLQHQLNNLASQVQAPNQDQPILSPITVVDEIGSDGFMETLSSNNETSKDAYAKVQRSSRLATSQKFYGPTSPEYALNLAQLKFRQHSCSGPPLQERQIQLAGIDEEEEATDDDDPQDAQDSGLSVSPRALERADPTQLLNFRSVMSLQEAIQLLNTYHEVVGELHPVVDIDALIAQTRAWYANTNTTAGDGPATSTRGASYELLLIINLALAIALRADSKLSSRHTEILLRESFEDAVNAKLATTAYSVKHVTIILLKVSLLCLPSMTIYPNLTWLGLVRFLSRFPTIGVASCWTCRSSVDGARLPQRRRIKTHPGLGGSASRGFHTHEQHCHPR